MQHLFEHFDNFTAFAAQSRGASVFLIGGTLSASGGVATGGAAERAAERCARDFCLPGACGLPHSFGLSADETGEVGIKRAVALASTTVIVVTDDNADTDALSAMRKASVVVYHG